MNSQSLIHSLGIGLRRIGAAIVTLAIAGALTATARAQALHTYGNSTGHEVVNDIAVDMAKLRPLVPVDYTIVPASAVLFGRPDQGLVIIANFQAFNPIVDRSLGHRPQVAIDLAVLIAEPANAASIGLSIPGAYHVYTLRIFTDDARYAESLRSGGMPVEFIEQIGYQRTMDNETGVGDLNVTLPDRYPFLYSVNTGQGYALGQGAFNAVFWHDGERGTAVLNFVDQPFFQGGALSRIYTRPNGTLSALFDGAGLGPCPTDPNTGFKCILAPSLNLRYDRGTVGKLQLLSPKRHGYHPFPQWVRM
jgi:hypothetical protein